MTRTKGSGTKDINEPTTVKVNFNKSGKGHTSTRMNIAASWLKNLGITKEEPFASVKYDGDQIIIKKDNKK